MNLFRNIAFTCFSIGATAFLSADVIAPACPAAPAPAPKKECHEGAFPINRFSLHAEGFYWSVAEDNLPFANEHIVKDNNGVVPNIDKTTNHEKHFNFNWTPGFRVGIGYDIPSSCWNADLQWTHFCGHASGHEHGSITSPVTDNQRYDLYELVLGPNELNAPLCDKVHGNWHIQFDSVEFVFDRPCHLTEYCCISPFIGIKYDQIEQSFKTKGHRTAPLDTVAAQLAKVSIRGCSEYQGVGVVLGTEGKMNFECGIGVFSEVAAGLTYGCARAHADQKVLLYSGIPTPSTSYVRTKANDYVGRVNVDFAIGLDWDYAFRICQKCMCLTFFAAYEYHQYFNQNLFSALPTRGVSSGGDLIMQGINFGADLSF